MKRPTYRRKETAPNSDIAKRWVIHHKLFGRKVRVRGRLTKEQRETMIRNDRKTIRVHRRGCCGTYGLAPLRFFLYNDFKFDDVAILKRLGVKDMKWDIYVY